MVGKRKTLQIMPNAGRADGRRDCTKLSRLLSEVLEAADRFPTNMCWRFLPQASTAIDGAARFRPLRGYERE